MRRSGQQPVEGCMWVAPLAPLAPLWLYGNGVTDGHLLNQ